MKNKKAIISVLVGVLILLIAEHSLIAVGLVKTGNKFFGGNLPYNLTAADTLYKAALVFDQEVPDAWHQRARISFLRGNFKVAREQIDRQIYLHGESFMASYYISGLIYGYAKNYSFAEKDFLHFLEWSPDNWAANNDLAWIYFVQGKFELSASRSKNSLLKDPFNPWLLVMHAMSLYNLGDKVTAERELQLAKVSAEGLTEERWIHAYPGNDPAIAKEGLSEFRNTIDRNITLVHSSKKIP